MNIEPNINPNCFLDFRKVVSFVGLLEMSRRFGEMKSGKKMEIIVRDMDTIADICKLLPGSSYKMTIKEEKGAINRIKIEKILAK